MAFEAFLEQQQALNHKKRLALSSLVSGGLLGAALVAAAATAPAEATRPMETIEEVLDVKLASKPDAPEPPPPAPAPPAPAALVPKSVKINPNAPPPKPLEAPKEISKEKPKEADPSQDKGVAGVHEGGDVAGRGTGTPRATAAPAPTPAPTPTPSAAPPPPPKVVSISEDTEPPTPLSQPRPAPPAEFVAAGEDAVVVVKFEVTESGDVTNVRVVKGHPMLDAIVLATVRTWRFKPAMSQGKPVAYPKTVKLPFRIRT